MNVLVVDDEPVYRLLLKNYLILEGWTVFTAEDGEDALEQLDKEKVDLVVSDVFMPVMDGIKLHKMVREKAGYERVPFLFVSAYDDEHTMESVKDPRIDGFLKKGKSMNELKEWLQYLTGPDDVRPKFPPGQTSSPGPYDQFRSKPGDPKRQN